MNSGYQGTWELAVPVRKELLLHPELQPGVAPTRKEL